MTDQDLTGGHAAGIARGAAVIAGLTVLSRILGLVGTLVFTRLPLSAELILSVGTTLGVAALVAVAVWPTWRLHLMFRPWSPTWRTTVTCAQRSRGCGRSPGAFLTRRYTSRSPLLFVPALPRGKGGGTRRADRLVFLAGHRVPVAVMAVAVPVGLDRDGLG